MGWIAFWRLVTVRAAADSPILVSKFQAVLAAALIVLQGLTADSHRQPLLALAVKVHDSVWFGVAQVNFHFREQERQIEESPSSIDIEGPLLARRILRHRACQPVAVHKPSI